MHMRVIRLNKYLELNKEIDVISFMEENDYHILLSYGKLFLTRVYVSPEDVGLEGGSLDSIEIWGSIFVPSGTFEEASMILKTRPYEEDLLGKMKRVDAFMDFNYN